MSSGPKITRDGLVFYYDVNNTKSLIGKPATNFYTNGDFTNGSGITQEAGSNPTNQIVIYPNPGNSQYVLRQTGNYTEYQINLTSQLSSSTTYVLSGWYAESNDYDGSSTMFHCRAFSSSGSHVALGNGIGTVIRTVNAGGLNWKYCYVTITTPSDYNGDFNWYVGYGQPSCNGYRYYTNLQMEIGSYPTTFVDGTRSVTQGLKDLTRNLTMDLTNISFDSNSKMVFDGTNDFINCGLVQPFDLNSRTVTWESVVKFNNSTGVDALITRWDNALGSVWWFGRYPTTKIHIAFIINGGYYAYFSDGDISSTLNYYHITVTLNDTVLSYYINGVLDSTDSVVTGTWTEDPDTSLIIGAQNLGTAANLSGEIPISKIYNRTLSSDEVLQNYNALKHRFGL
jgi:hypothetical protein